MDIKAKIRHYREEKKYSQEYIANKLGVSQNAYSRLENGSTKIDFEKATKLAEILEISPHEFLPKEFGLVNFSSNHNQEVVKNAYILYEYQKEAFESTILIFKEELKNIREERKQEREDFMKMIEKLLSK